MARAVGIDLGTTYSLVATVQQKKPVVLAEDTSHADGRVPSAVYFAKDGDVFVGQKQSSKVNWPKTAMLAPY